MKFQYNLDTWSLNLSSSSFMTTSIIPNQSWFHQISYNIYLGLFSIYCNLQVSQKQTCRIVSRYQNVLQFVVISYVENYFNGKLVYNRGTPSYMKLFRISISTHKNSIDLGLLRSGSVHDFKTVSLSFLVILLQLLVQYFETIPSVHISWNNPHLKVKCLFKYKWHFYGQ